MIPESNHLAALERMNEQKAFQVNQRYLFESECKQVHKLLFEF